MSIPLILSNKLITTNALWNILDEYSAEITNQIQSSINDIPIIDISGKADKINPIFSGGMMIGNVIGVLPNQALAQGQKNYISGLNAFAQGTSNYIMGDNSSAKGTGSAALATASFAEGQGTVTELQTVTISNNNQKDMILSLNNQTANIGNIMEGDLLIHPGSNTVRKILSYSSTYHTITVDTNLPSITTGWHLVRGSVAGGSGAHAEGQRTKATGNNSHTEGINTKASSLGAHAEGTNTHASGQNSHAEGNVTQASGQNSHAEGNDTKASQSNTHAEGVGSIASGAVSHAEGFYSQASGVYSHAEGFYTIAKGKNEHTSGAYNVADTAPEWVSSTAYNVGDFILYNSNIYECKIANNDSTFQSSKWELSGKYLSIIGNGVADNARSNAYALDWDGTAHYAGNVYVSANSDSTGGVKVATVNEIPTLVSQLTNDSGYLTSFTETDPTVPSWAKAAQKPTYTATEVGAPTVQEMNTAISTAIGNIASATQDQEVRTALIAFLDEFVLLVPNLAYSSNSHNGAATISAANALITALEGSSSGDEPGGEVLEPIYTENVLYSNYTPSGQRFSTSDVSIDFAAGDYIEAQIDATTCTQDQENILAVGKNSTTYIEGYDSAVAFLFYKRAQSGVDKILVRLQDTDSSISVDRWIEVANMANVVIRIDKDGIIIDGNRISGITAENTAHLTGLGTYIIGARASKLTTATYDHITVYNVP